MKAAEGWHQDLGCDGDYCRVGLRKVVTLAALLIIPCVTVTPADAASCESLATLSLPHTTITLAQSVPAGEFTPPLAPDAPAGSKPSSTERITCLLPGGGHLQPKSRLRNQD